MLRFREIVIEDFGPYKGEQRLGFPNDDGVIVIYGENGRGKTSLLNAFRYALFGEVKKEGQEDLSLHEISNKESAAEGKYGFKVILRFSYEGSNFELTRHAEPREGVVPQDGGDYKEGTILKKDGNVLGPEERKRELSHIMPEGVSRFFLFDGELLREYEELLKEGSEVGEEIKEAIEQILGVPILKNARKDLKALHEEARKEVQRELKKSKEGQQMAAQLEDLAAHRQHHEEEIKRLQDERDKLLEEKGKIDEFMNQYQQARKKLEKRQRLTGEIKKIEEEIEQKREKLKEEMSSAWKGMLGDSIKTARTEVQNKLGEHRQRQAAAETVELIQKALDDNECSICGQSLSKEAMERLNEKLSDAQRTAGSTLNEEDEAFYTEASSLLNAFDVDAGSVALAKSLHEDIQNLEVRRYDKEDKLEELRDQTIDVEDKESEINAKDERRESIIEELSILRSGIEDERAELKKKEETTRKLEERQINYDDEDLEAAQLRRDTYIDLHSLFDTGVAAYRDRLREKVEADASSLFTKLSHEDDYTGLSINENYGLSVLLENGETISARSSGEGQVVALSLMGALQNNAPLQGPIIMDSSFTRLDGRHKKNVVKALPEMSSQVMLLVFEDELAPEITRNQLPEHLRAEYDMVRETATHTRLEPKA
jgi:DNA sulfur modification protein DndD